jgi:hypothetical protein
MTKKGNIITKIKINMIYIIKDQLKIGSNYINMAILIL